MLADKKLMAFLATSNAVKARDFYQNILGLTLVDEHEFALVFDAFGIELRIQKIPEFTALAQTVLGWSVPDIAHEISELAAKGVAFIQFEGMEQDELGIWQTPSGARVAWFKDCDGNTLSLTES